MESEQKLTRVVCNYPSPGAMKWPRLWRDALDSSRTWISVLDTILDTCEGCVLENMMKGKVDFRTCWQDSGCNKSIKEVFFFKASRDTPAIPPSSVQRWHHETTKAFNVVLTGDHGAVSVWHIGDDEQDWRTRFLKCAWGDGPSVGSWSRWH